MPCVVTRDIIGRQFFVNNLNLFRGSASSFCRLNALTNRLKLLFENIQNILKNANICVTYVYVYFYYSYFGLSGVCSHLFSVYICARGTITHSRLAIRTSKSVITLKLHKRQPDETQYTIYKIKYFTKNHN